MVYRSLSFHSKSKKLINNKTKNETTNRYTASILVLIRIQAIIGGRT